MSSTSNSLCKVLASVFHCICSLSVSNTNCAWHGVYHPLCAPRPRNVTLRVHTARAGLQIRDKTLAFSCKLFQHVASAPPLVLHHVIKSESWKPGFLCRTHPNSFATTSGILFSFLSSACPPSGKISTLSDSSSRLTIERYTLVRLDHTQHHSRRRCATLHMSSTTKTHVSTQLTT